MNGIIEDEITTGTPMGEIIPAEDKASELFVPNGLDKIIALIRKEVEQHQPDISTDKGRKAIASLARKVASSKSRLEEYGKNLSAKIKVQAVGIDAERKRMRETLDELRDQARKPLDEYEAAVKARVEGHEQSLRELAELSNVPFGATVADIDFRLLKLDEFALRNWEEFSDRFGVANEAVSMRLGKILAETKKQDAERAAFKKSEEERLIREAEESKARLAKEQAERDERVAREATEMAQRESAEREAKTERDAEAAEARAMKAEQNAKDAAERAVQAEQKRVAHAKAKEDAEEKSRENDKKHRAIINNAAIAALMELHIHGIPEIEQFVAREIIQAIAQGKISNVKMVY